LAWSKTQTKITGVENFEEELLGPVENSEDHRFGKPGSPHSKKQIPSPPDFSIQISPARTQKYRADSSPSISGSPANSRPNSIRKARFTPQQEADTVATRFSIQISPALTRKYFAGIKRVPFREGHPSFPHAFSPGPSHVIP
jgi:hypothetical protein